MYKQGLALNNLQELICLKTQPTNFLWNLPTSCYQPFDLGWLIVWVLCISPFLGGARGVMVIIIGNGHGDTSSNPGRDWLHFTKDSYLRKGMNPIILPPAMGK